MTVYLVCMLLCWTFTAKSVHARGQTRRHMYAFNPPLSPSVLCCGSAVTLLFPAQSCGWGICAAEPGTGQHMVKLSYTCPWPAPTCPSEAHIWPGSAEWGAGRREIKRKKNAGAHILAEIRLIWHDLSLGHILTFVGCACHLLNYGSRVTVRI